ncbi:hypothetical protein [Stakelama pacifica]|uniref:Uncharacterized protein n=1 Tax=Stakelama pacifica TaxID=517720 RepID=A0A4R6FJZ2_9SPHN|nr:hypothetical protein [Stakelama pacifica]TDN81782.1 hypothetical protein EV664_107184 [Stakelama pacifica]GGO96553.1 hypothetical protein GCM10011329_23350 [Stakelama pacifica]
MNLAAAFESLAGTVAAAVGAPFYAAERLTETAPVLDAGGSIVTPGTLVRTPCRCQVDDATDAMRQDASFVQGDVRLIVLGLDSLTTDARISVTEGPGAGTYSVQSVSRDPAGVGFVCRGRVDNG